MDRGSRAGARGARGARRRGRCGGPPPAGRLRLRDADRARAPAQRDDAAAAADGRRLRAAGPRAAGPARRAGRGRARRWSRCPAGRHEVGAPDRGFAYDNERPRHEVELAAFLIDRTPVTNASLRGLRRRDRGGAADVLGARRRGRLGHDDLRPPGRARSDAAGDPRRPRRRRGLRALGGQAAADRVRVGGRRRGCRSRSLQPRRHARSAARRPAPTRTAPPTAARVQMLGDVWEWTSSELDGLPGLRGRSPTPSTPRSSSATGLQGPPRRLLGDAAQRDPHRASATGTCPARGRSSPASAAPGTRTDDDRGVDDRDRGRPARGRRAGRHGRGSFARASPARSRSCRRSTSTTSAGRSCSSGSPSCPSTTRPAASARSSPRTPPRSSPPPSRAR